MGEEFDVACLRVQSVGSVTQVGEPDESVTVDIQSGNLSAEVLDQCGLLSVGELEYLTRFGTDEDVISVGGQTGDVLVFKIPFALEREVRHVDAVHTFVRTHPDVITIALYHSIHSQIARRNQVLLETVTVQTQLVESYVVV